MTAALIVSSSYSVFTPGTSSPGNGWTTGTVSLTNDSASTSGVQSSVGAALFIGADAAGLRPNGPALEKCITVRSAGSLAGEVRVYGTGATDTGSLLQHLDVAIDIGVAAGTDGGSCASFNPSGAVHPRGTLRAFADAVSQFSSGETTGWSPTGSAAESRAFRIRIWPRSTMGDPQQASTASIAFAWEERNT